MCYKGQYLREKSALPVLRSSVLVSVVGSVVKCSSSVEEEAFVELPATLVCHGSRHWNDKINVY